MSKATKEGFKELHRLEHKYGPTLNGITEPERQYLLNLMWPEAIYSDSPIMRHYQNYHKQGLSEAQTIAKLFKDGHSARSIAKTMGLGQQDVLEALKHQGIAVNRTRIYDAKIKPKLGLIKDMRAQGFDKIDIAQALGVDSNALRYAARTHHVVAKAMAEGEAIWNDHKKLLREKTLKERVRDA